MTGVSCAGGSIHDEWTLTPSSATSSVTRKNSVKHPYSIAGVGLDHVSHNLYLGVKIEADLSCWSPPQPDHPEGSA